ncbi:MAG: hypothetical protein R3E01_31800 [Pirellulaceae bacterium]
MNRLTLFVVLLSFTTPCWGQFDTIINVPPDAPLESIESNTQLNLFDGGAISSSSLFVGGLNGTASNAEFNMHGGTAGSIVVNQGGVANIFAGAIRRGVLSNTLVNIYGGQIGRTVSADHSLSVANGSTANIYGGVFPNNIEVGMEAELNIHGGSFEGANFFTRDRAEVNFFGRKFFVDGIEQTDLVVGQRRTFFDNGHFYSGILSDGSAFNLAVTASAFGSITLVPEPSCPAYLTTLVVSLLLARRKIVF